MLFLLRVPDEHFCPTGQSPKTSFLFTPILLHLGAAPGPHSSTPDAARYLSLPFFLFLLLVLCSLAQPNPLFQTSGLTLPPILQI